MNSCKNTAKLINLWYDNFGENQKEKRNIGKFTSKLTFLWYDQKPTSLCVMNKPIVICHLFYFFSLYHSSLVFKALVSGVS